MKVLYKPLGIIASVLGGLIASKLFQKLWATLAHEDEAPKPRDAERGWKEIAAAAVLQGAVVGGVKAVADRGAATGFQKATGTWPAA